MRLAAFSGAALALFSAAAAGARPVRVDLDARLELAGAADWLAAPKSSSTPDALASFPYARELAGRLAAPAAPELSAPATGWTFADRARLMLSLSPLPALERLGSADDADVERAGGAAALERRLTALRDFARASNFDAAFNASRYLLDADAANVRRRLAAAAPLASFEAYAGLSAPRTVVLLSPFSAAGPAPGVVTIRDDGTASLTVVVGPKASTSVPSGLDFWSERLPEALWNESAQISLAPLAALYSDRIAQSSRFAAGPDGSCARDWRRCVEDQAARAVTLRLAARRYGKNEAAARRAGLEGADKSPVLAALLASLERYEKARRASKSGAGLADFYPDLLASLPLDEPDAAPAPPRLPDASSLSPERRRRLAAFLKAIAPKTRDPRLKDLAAAAGAWARDAARALPSGNDFSSGPARISTAAASADELRSRGMEEFAAGKNEAALADFQSALAAAPRDAQTLASEAAVLATLGRDEEALAADASALESARSSGGPASLMLAADVLSSRASILELRGQGRKAAADLEDALRSAPPDWPRRDEARKRLEALRTGPGRHP